MLVLSRIPIFSRLVTIAIDDANAVLTGNEPVFHNGQVIGQITSGNHGVSVGKYIAFAYLPIEHTTPGTPLEVEYLTERYAAVVAEDAMFDAENARMKA